MIDETQKLDFIKDIKTIIDLTINDNEIITIHYYIDGYEIIYKTNIIVKGSIDIDYVITKKIKVKDIKDIKNFYEKLNDDIQIIQIIENINIENIKKHNTQQKEILLNRIKELTIILQDNYKKTIYLFIITLLFIIIDIIIFKMNILSTTIFIILIIFQFFSLIKSTNKEKINIKYIKKEIKEIKQKIN